MEARRGRIMPFTCGGWTVDCEGDCGSGIEEACHADGAWMQREVGVQMMDSSPCCKGKASSDAAAGVGVV